MKFTKPPWSVVPPTRERPSRATVCGHDGQVDIYDAPLTSETEANARLIAAAPQLLAACMMAQEALSGSCATVAAIALQDVSRAMAKALGK